MKITIFGTGYVGLVTGASLANLGHTVLGVDVDQEKINALQQGTISFYEPGLKELVARNREQGRLSFSSHLAEGINFGEVLFTCVGTPSTGNGAADLEAVYTVAKEVAKEGARVTQSRFQGQSQTKAENYKILVNKSTVPPGTARKCQQLLQEMNPSGQIEVVSNPEFLKQGNAVYDFNHPDKIVIGAETEKAVAVMRKVYQGLLKTYIPFLEMNWETAEMVKYANNTFLATKISFINEIANICQLVEADVKQVAQAMGLDYRIGPKFLNAGIGYGGSCFSKDLRALISAAEEHGYSAKLLQEVDAFNERQKNFFLPKIIQKLKRVNGNTVTVWGASFKPKTSDLREAPAVSLIQELLSQGLQVRLYDPIALEEARRVFNNIIPHKTIPNNAIHYSSSIADSVQGSNLIVLVTEWDEFRSVNFTELGTMMNSKILFDGRNIYDPLLIQAEGFEYYGVGRG
ncbi:MAG: UDP-glucose/GDP-mannose dehydrogenase family protein [Nanoarchaeota archaeon]